MTDRMKQDGVVLISVLWVIAGLSIIVASNLTAVRTDIQLTLTHLRLAQARAISEAGIYWAINALLRPRDNARPGMPEDTVALDWGDARVSLSIENDAGRIDINTADARLIESALTHAGVDTITTSKIVAGLERSRTPLEASEPVDETGNRTFQTVEDFAAGLDVPVDVKQRLISRFTVYNGREGVNPLAAGREVLLAVPGMSEGRVESYLEERENHPFSTPGPGFDQAYFTDRLSAVYTITARTRIDGATATVGTKVRLSSLRDTPFDILAWRSSVDFDQG